jgi:hypothetical protein
MQALCQQSFGLTLPRNCAFFRLGQEDTTLVLVRPDFLVTVYRVIRLIQRARGDNLDQNREWTFQHFLRFPVHFQS